MVYLAYYDKRGLKRNINQLTMHRDNLYDFEGTFLDTANSQEEHTATCILSIGDTRKLEFQCYKHSMVEGEVPVTEGYNSHTFSLTHGSLFVLHPKDEQTIIREYFDDISGTYFKHGNVLFGKDGLSIGLVFRTTRPEFAKQVFMDSGCLVDSDDGADYDVYETILNDYLLNTNSKAKDDDKFKQLYLKVKEQYF